MGRKSTICLICVFIYLFLFLAAGVYVLRDNTCGGTDKVSLEKRCQSAVNYNKAKQVNL
ncbi:hypothetical protein PROVRUST_05585 [Providencia rustigianii DSM 4541]|uniref:Hok/gef family protein n=1 Tax=Providencia rustigianii DSM 4541 TaxID=500637 RepID=D1P076_9GAMM|nr:hypothetical protein PROVRUST_05585 [Providencia rustigianii DSM 4541]SUC26304.1 Uncharacterised protein [Providencia rustigianii]